MFKRVFSRLGYFKGPETIGVARLFARKSGSGKLTDLHKLFHEMRLSFSLKLVPWLAEGARKTNQDSLCLVVTVGAITITPN